MNKEKAGHKTHIFTYGTLMTEKIWQQVVSGEYKSQSAILKDYSCRQLKKRLYPGLIRAPGQIVTGKIYYNISHEDINRLDQYEGEEYKRIKVSLIINKQMIQAETYLYHDNFQINVLPDIWSIDDFIKNHLTEYLTHYFS